MLKSAIWFALAGLELQLGQYTQMTKNSPHAEFAQMENHKVSFTLSVTTDGFCCPFFFSAHEPQPTSLFTTEKETLNAPQRIGARHNDQRAKLRTHVDKNGKRRNG